MTKTNLKNIALGILGLTVNVITKSSDLTKQSTVFCALSREERKSFVKNLTAGMITEISAEAYGAKIEIRDEKNEMLVSDTDLPNKKIIFYGQLFEDRSKPEGELDYWAVLDVRLGQRDLAYVMDTVSHEFYKMFKGTAYEAKLSSMQLPDSSEYTFIERIYNSDTPMLEQEADNVHTFINMNFMKALLKQIYSMYVQEKEKSPTAHQGQVTPIVTTTAPESKKELFNTGGDTVSLVDMFLQSNKPTVQNEKNK